VRVTGQKRLTYELHPVLGIGHNGIDVSIHEKAFAGFATPDDTNDIAAFFYVTFINIQALHLIYDGVSNRCLLDAIVLSLLCVWAKPISS
jgi:hypothetical protein